MRAIIKNKKAFEMGFVEIIYLILGLLIVFFIVSSLFGVNWGAIVKGWIPKWDTTTNNDYSLIEGTDESVYSVPVIPSFNDIQVASSASSCPYFVRKVNDNLFGVYNSVGSLIGSFQRKQGSTSVWVLFDLEKFNSFYEQNKPLDLNAINYGGKLVDGLVLFDGKAIHCDTSNAEVEESSVVKNVKEYYVSDSDCYGLGEKYCIKYSQDGKEINTNFYFTEASFLSGQSYTLFYRRTNWFLADRKMCDIYLNGRVDATCDLAISSYSDLPKISGTRLSLLNGKYVFVQSELEV